MILFASAVIMRELASGRWGCKVRELILQIKRKTFCKNVAVIVRSSVSA